MKNRRKAFSGTKYIILLSALLLLTNIILGIVMYNQSRNTVRDLVSKNMLSISNTAAGLLDGDLLDSFTQKDVGSPAWQKVIDDLRVFQNNIDIEYIYTVRKTEDGHFVFLVDPDPVNPGEFGEDVVMTPALISAGNGKASVDVQPAADEWGNFYSSYSPVFDSGGKLAAIVGVDFDANWYESQIQEHMLPALIIIIVFVVICIILIFWFSRKFLQRVETLNTQLEELTENVDELIADISQEVNVYDPDTEVLTAEKMHAEERGNELEILSGRLKDMQEELRLYQEFAEARANTDALTGVNNTTAYTHKQEQMNLKIGEGTAAFAIVMFDINDLKIINDKGGHAAGDEIIHSAGRSISSVFGRNETFRIGGDEFLVIDETLTPETMDEKLEMLDATIAFYNAGRETNKLSLSVGFSFYNPGQDLSFRDVFVRADENMYKNKQEYHNSVKSHEERGTI